MWQEVHANAIEANVSGHSTPQGDGELPETTPETPNDSVVASGTTEEHDGEDITDYCGNKSNQDELRENAANFDLESASGDCLTCSDTEEVAIRTTGKKFWKEV